MIHNTARCACDNMRFLFQAPYLFIDGKTAEHGRNLQAFFPSDMKDFFLNLYRQLSCWLQNQRLRKVFLPYYLIADGNRKRRRLTAPGRRSPDHVLSLQHSRNYLLLDLSGPFVAEQPQ